MSLIGNIVPRSPVRILSNSAAVDRFITWLEEQFTKIRASLDAREQIINSNFVQVGNPAAAGAQILHTYVIPIGIFDGQAIERITVRAFGELAANGNTKTLDVRVNNTSIALIASIGSNLDWMTECHFYIISASVQKAIGYFKLDTVANDVQYTALAINLLTTAITITFHATSSASAANDVIVHGFAVEMARTERQ